MIIAITSDGSESSSLVAEKFGRASFIIMFDTEKNTFLSLRNPYANLFDGAGIQTAQFIIEHNPSLVITVDIGLNPLRFLNSTGIKVYSCSQKQIQFVINEFLEGKLSEVKQKIIRKLNRRMHRGKGDKRKEQMKW